MVEWGRKQQCWLFLDFRQGVALKCLFKVRVEDYQPIVGKVPQDGTPMGEKPL